MSLLSLPFFFFVAVVFLVYRGLDVKWQNRWLLSANVCFFASWGWESLASVSALTAALFLIGRKLGSSRNARAKNIWTAAAVVITFGALLAVQIRRQDMFFEVALPLGLSFYSLQLLSYIFEIQRGQIRPAKNFFELFLFSSFFPVACMGPIERFSHMQPQFQNPRRLNAEKIGRGFFLIVFGIFKKMVIAERLAAAGRQLFAADPVFGAGDACVFLLFSFFLLYADFSGYSDIARGLGKIFGFDIVENFRRPYFASTLGDFLTRWHISLIDWVKDFIYWPVALKTRNLALATCSAFLALAFWHGFDWRRGSITLYLAAIYFGFWAYRRLAPRFSWRKSGPYRFFSSVAVLLLVSVSFLFALAPPSGWFEKFTPVLFASSSFFSVPGLAYDLAVAGAALGGMMFFESYPPRAPSRAIPAAAILLLLTLAFGTSNSMYFLYMRF
jgi:D-alanyl-lipoteichoic acid acyltransferase DltB (MBOAT superfamily)